jgi:hypothetical protein
MLLRILRIVLAVASLVAMAVQFNDSSQHANFNPVNFFSFFTNVCNIFGAAVFLIVAFGVVRSAHARDVVRGAATLYLTIVGVVFSILLANLESILIPWVNVIVHYVMPIAVVVDWFIDPPSTTITRADIARWLIVPLAYLAYTMARGAFVHWYPYPFMNADVLGYGVIPYLLAIVVFTLLVSWVLVALGRRLGAPRYQTNGNSR